MPRSKLVKTSLVGDRRQTMSLSKLFDPDVGGICRGSF